MPCEGPDPAEQVQERTRRVLERLAEEPGLLRERSVACRWGELLAAADRIGVGRAPSPSGQELGRRALDALLGNDDLSGVGSRTDILRAVDGMLGSPATGSG